MEISVYGMGPMGINLSKNIASRGHDLVVYSRSHEEIDRFMEQGVPRNVRLTDNLDIAADHGKQHWLMIKAGAPTDSVLSELSDRLRTDSVILEGGNSHYTDTDRRMAQFEERGIGYIGAGISGGARGALLGPSIMAGGKKKTYEKIQPVLEETAAQYRGEPCARLLGRGSAGHYVKMVHNGIEYADMQLIAEMYDVMVRGGMSQEKISSRFQLYDKSDAQSYLMGLASHVLRLRMDDHGNISDSGEGSYLTDVIDDIAEMKGTGLWTVLEAYSLDPMVAVPTLQAAVNARIISQETVQRSAARHYSNAKDLGEEFRVMGEWGFQKALFFGRVMAYNQGFNLLRQGSQKHDYGLDLKAIPRVWKNGSILQSFLLNDLEEALEREDAPIYVDAESLRRRVHEGFEPAKTVARLALKAYAPVPCLHSAIDYYTASENLRLSTSLIQLMRDGFGQHGLKKDGRVFHIPSFEYPKERIT